jgi:hypothetical protein
VTNGTNLSTLNSNFSKIADALNNAVLYRQNPGTEPNQLLNDVDLNGNNLLNVGTINAQDVLVDSVSITAQVESATAASNSAIASANAASLSAQDAAASASSATTTLTSSLKKASNLSDVVDPAASLANIGGVNASQAASVAPVQKVAGRIGDITLAVTDVTGAAATANNLSDLSNATTARTNLGLGTMATQSATSIAITGGTINGVTMGNIGVGSAPTTSVIQTSAPITGGTTAFGIVNANTIQSGVTTSASINYAQPSTQAASFTITEINYFDAAQGTIGAGSTVVSQYGFRVRPSLVGATNNYGFRGQIPAAAGRWNVYMDGTANNYLAGNLQIGSSTPTAGAENLQVGGSLSISSATLIRTYTAFTNGAAAATGTLTNAPVAGNPTKWIPINDNGTIRYIPAW